jgi:hypothetical protein
MSNQDPSDKSDKSAPSDNSGKVNELDNLTTALFRSIETFANISAKAQTRYSAAVVCGIYKVWAEHSITKLDALARELFFSKPEELTAHQITIRQRIAAELLTALGYKHCPDCQQPWTDAEGTPTSHTDCIPF